MPLTSGTKLGPYEIQAPLGAGGMGEVYRARDTRLDRDVAIKVLPTNLASDPSLRQRLEREAKAVSKLTHAHICTLHDIGHHDGVDFLVMELPEGETLEQRLMKGPLAPEQTIRIAAQIADALAKAHKVGITHRDLKPGNIMLTKAGAKLMDFGLAKESCPAPLTAALTEMTMEQAKLTSEGMLVGTFQYMAPEQLEGKEADPRTDIFALGELIYEMVWKGVFSSSFNGVLAYQGGNTGANSRLVTFDRTGKELKSIGAPGDFNTHRISPDGQRLAVGVLDSSVRNYKLWIYDLFRDKQTRLTFGPGRTTFPVWAPDGSAVGFASNRTGIYQIVEQRSDGTGSEEPLLEANISKYPTDWSADRRFIAFNTTSRGKSATELWILPRFGERKPYAFLKGNFSVGQGHFSPDGRWMTYSSDESGRVEVYVTPFPDRRSVWQISQAGGSNPRWRRDGKELYYLAVDSKLMAAEVNGSSSIFQMGAARPLFQVMLKTGASRLDLGPTSGQISYDSAPDGMWFVVNSPPLGIPPPVTLITNWAPQQGK